MLEEEERVVGYPVAIAREFSEFILFDVMDSEAASRSQVDEGLAPGDTGREKILVPQNALQQMAEQKRESQERRRAVVAGEHARLRAARESAVASEQEWSAAAAAVQRRRRAELRGAPPVPAKRRRRAERSATERECATAQEALQQAKGRADALEGELAASRREVRALLDALAASRREVLALRDGARAQERRQRCHLALVLRDPELCRQLRLLRDVLAEAESDEEEGAGGGSDLISNEEAL